MAPKPAAKPKAVVSLPPEPDPASQVWPCRRGQVLRCHPRGSTGCLGGALIRPDAALSHPPTLPRSCRRTCPNSRPSRWRGSPRWSWCCWRTTWTRPPPARRWPRAAWPRSCPPGGLGAQPAAWMTRCRPGAGADNPEGWTLGASRLLRQLAARACLLTPPPPLPSQGARPAAGPLWRARPGHRRRPGAARGRGRRRRDLHVRGGGAALAGRRSLAPAPGAALAAGAGYWS
jgi:hypothetical protein